MIFRFAIAESINMKRKVAFNFILFGLNTFHMILNSIVIFIFSEV